MPRYAVFIALTLPVAGAAADPPFLGPDADPMLAIKCRQKLAAHPRLAGLSVTVDVVNRVALVGGPVPSAETGPQIAALLNGVPGLETVKLSCWVAAACDPLLDRIGEKLRGETPAPPAPPREPLTRDANGLPPLLLLPHAAPAEPRRDVSGPPPAPPPVATVTRYASTPDWLGEPIAPPKSQLPALLEQARAAETRFARLKAEAKDGVVSVSGRVRDHADTWDYVATVRRLPGVSRVAVGLVVAD